jgi:hypothetical protein
LGRQTDGLWCVVSNHAILDRDLDFHWTTSSQSEIIARLETVKKSNGGWPRFYTREKSTKRDSRNSRVSRRCFRRISWKEPQSVYVDNYRIVMICKTKIHFWFIFSEPTSGLRMRNSAASNRSSKDLQTLIR